MKQASAHLNEAIASNGLSVRENFLTWFGDSKMVLESGEPQVFYHGTRADFDCFRADRDIAGHFFSPSAQYAGYIAGDEEDEWTGQVLMPVYLQISNPLDVTLGLDAAAGRKLLRHGARKSQLEWLELPSSDQWMVFQRSEGGFDFVSAARRAGFDGVRFMENSSETAVAVFSPMQIKSAVGNTGLFSPYSRSMTDHSDHLSLLRALQARRSIAGTLMAQGVRP